ncbi:DUF1232 domain-containing protein [Spiractinospora alimapuensis]|uniref:YkvA family protein n=1 Tax=Spiractinospora alimapuensis TaxID=2820884 RepID=UPI001F3C8ACC|nr:YkvA family protein [Spiractinospora alimapuensis]QVQ50089.1 DUF1232 domain-containing protein [Spiractinospora alimapuensis]
MRSANRAAAGAAAWQVVHDATKPGKPSVWARTRAVPRMFGARFRGDYVQLTKSRILLMILAVGYIVSPIDFIPELIVPILGVVDDIGVAVWLAAAVLGETERYLHWEHWREAPLQGHVVDE